MGTAYEHDVQHPNAVAELSWRPSQPDGPATVGLTRVPDYPSCMACIHQHAPRFKACAVCMPILTHALPMRLLACENARGQFLMAVDSCDGHQRCAGTSCTTDIYTHTCVIAWTLGNSVSTQLGFSCFFFNTRVQGKPYSSMARISRSSSFISTYGHEPGCPCCSQAHRDETGQGP